MKRRLTLLAASSLYISCLFAFSIHDDLLAFPEYEVVFSNKYVSQDEAKLRLAQAASAQPADHVVEPEPSESLSSDLSTRGGNSEDAGEDGMPVEDHLQTYERVILDKRPYLCSIPILQPSKNETEEEVTPQDEEKELARATDRGWQLLQDMHGQCLYYQSGWWSYSFCYQTEVRQFHPVASPRGDAPIYPPVEDPRVPAFVLGEFHNGGQSAKSAAKSKDNKAPAVESTELAVQSKGDIRYLSQNLTGGTLCDLTGKPRRVEVQFHCHPQSTDRIGWIKETATCAYLMVIYTPRLCNDVAFLPPKEHKAEQIICREVVSDSELEGWHALRAAEAEQLLLASSSKTASRPVVGGIEVGGYNEVPHEGARIPQPQVIEQIPNQGDVIAQWHPNQNGGVIKTMSDSDLRKLELDPTAVEQMKEQIHREANGRPWKMEIVELAAGIRELIGVVETSEEERFDDEGGQPEGEGSQEVFKDEL